MTITVRTIGIKPSEIQSRYWYANSPVKTHFFNALSSTFPEGERFFIQSVRAYADQIDDPKLTADIRQFAGQEGQHSKEHDDHVGLLVAQGYRGILRFNVVQRRVMRWLARRLPRFSLAVTTAIEHITAVLANHLLSNPERWLAAMDSDARLLWHWHAVEETEHKAVAYDVYQQTGNEYWLRMFALFEATIGLFVEVFMRHTYLMAKDGLLFSASQWREGWVFLWGRHGLLRAIVKDLWLFTGKDFHPWDQDNSEFVEKFTQEYAGAFTTISSG